MRLSRIQPDPLLMPTTSWTGIKTKRIRPEYHDYSEHDQYQEPLMHKHNLNTEQNNLIEKQIRNALLSRKLQEEQRGQVLNQIEYDDPTKYHTDICQV